MSSITFLYSSNQVMYLRTYQRLYRAKISGTRNYMKLRIQIPDKFFLALPIVIPSIPFQYINNEVMYLRTYQRLYRAKISVLETRHETKDTNSRRVPSDSKAKYPVTLVTKFNRFDSIALQTYNLCTSASDQTRKLAKVKVHGS